MQLTISSFEEEGTLYVGGLEQQRRLGAGEGLLGGFGPLPGSQYALLELLT